MRRPPRGGDAMPAGCVARAILILLVWAASSLAWPVAVRAAAPTWNVVATPDPSGYDDELYATSCVGGAFCMAGGVSFTGSGARRTLVERWDGMRWSVVSSPNAGSQDDEVYGVSCVTAAFCMAAGYTATTSGHRTLTERWDGTSWTVVPSPNPSTLGDDLSAVSCTSPSFCMAGGQSATATGHQALVEQWEGTGWTAAASPNPAGVQDVQLAGLSCASATFCAVVGYSGPSSSHQTLVEQWNGTAWTLAVSPNPSGLDDELYAVSCVAVSFCVAAGLSSTGSGTFGDGLGSTRSLIEQWDGTAWGSVAAPPNPTVDTWLNSVSCASASFCVSASALRAGTTTHTLVQQWDGTAWANVPSPDPPSTWSPYLMGVSCLSASLCRAVGATYSAGSAAQTLAEEYRDWTSASGVATVAVVAGSLSLTVPGTISLPTATLGAGDTGTATTIRLDVADATGSGAGWRVTTTSTVFTNGTQTLPVSATTATVGAWSCAPLASCTVASSSAGSPYVLPAGAAAPPATTLVNAVAGTGEGAQSASVAFTVAVPANSYAGAYQSTWTFSIASGP